MKFIDDFLNKITMYRLVLYYLIVLLGIAFVLSFFNLLPFTPLALLVSTLLFVAVCWITNFVFAKVFNVTANVESNYITALILASIVTPHVSALSLIAMMWMSVLAMASKYILAINKKHIFNPAAVAVMITAFTIHQSASWWVGTATLLPVVIIGAILVVRKIRRFDLFATFLVTALVVIIGFGLSKGTDPLMMVRKVILDSPIIFFASIMLTEPSTTPPTHALQLIYGGLVGLLYAPSIHIGTIYSTPELTLLVGNIFSFIVCPKLKLILPLKEIHQLGADTYDYVFTTNQKLNFTPGQYMEWTLPVPHPDNRGNRRYFTLASSPTESDIRIGLKFYSNPSRFKQILGSMTLNQTIVASQLSGSFTLPKNPNQKCVFIAGGIGVTPFRSMVKYLIDTQQQRDIVLFYSNNTLAEIVYADVFSQAAQYGIKTIYTLTDTKQLPQNWQGKTGFIDAAMITQEVPDFKQRLFYLSGPHGMVVVFEKLLSRMGVPRHQIMVDYFPGYA